MKLFGKISIFMITASIIYAAGAYTGNWFYPNRNTDKRYETYDGIKDEDGSEQLTTIQGQTVSQYGYDIERAEVPRETIPAITQKSELTVDTEYVIEEYDMGLDRVTEVSEKLPAKYIGMDRDAFIEAMGEYEIAPAISDLEKGFLSLEVISFSTDKVVVRKTYQTGVRSNQFCLVAEDNFVVVYYGDLQTLFMYTDIPLDSLPKELQEEIIQIKYMTGEGELYTFLESYSS